MLARLDGLLDDAHGEQHFRNSIHFLESSSAELQLARTHLLYGEWLRRRKRLTEARVHLRTAHEAFAQRGLAGFAARTRIELEAAGEIVAPADHAPTADLTSQEAQVARLAADGLTNQEIASKLYLSPSTVDYHLRKVFRKLGISTRRRLREVLA
jgi:DNA-binding CsgD family transcriptional regulator